MRCTAGGNATTRLRPGERREAEGQVASVLPPPRTPVSRAQLGRAVATCSGENRRGNCFSAALQFINFLHVWYIYLAVVS